jgi:hypothetical protein
MDTQLPLVSVPDLLATVLVDPLLPYDSRWVVELLAIAPSAVGAAPAATGTFSPVVPDAALMSNVMLEPAVFV